MYKTINKVDYMSCFTTNHYEILEVGNSNKAKVIFKVDTFKELLNLMENLEKFI